MNAPFKVDTKRTIHPKSLANLVHGPAHWIGRIPDPIRAPRLVRLLVLEMNLNLFGFGYVAKAIGSAKNTPGSWRWKSVPKIDIFDDALGAVGCELAMRIRRQPHEEAGDFILGALS